MKSIARFLLAACFLGTSLVAGASELKIGFVNGHTLLAEVQPELEKKLRDQFSSNEQELVAKGQELQALQEKYKRESELMSAEELAEFEHDLMSKDRAFNRDHQAFAEELNMARNEEVQQFVNHVTGLIEQLAAEQHYDVILQKEAAVYLQGKYDITNDVMAALKKNPHKKSA